MTVVAGAGYSGDKVTGLDSWYTGFGGSGYVGASTEYTSGSTRVGMRNAVTHGDA